MGCLLSSHFGGKIERGRKGPEGNPIAHLVRDGHLVELIPVLPVVARLKHLGAAVRSARSRGTLRTDAKGV